MIGYHDDRFETYDPAYKSAIGHFVELDYWCEEFDLWGIFVCMPTIGFLLEFSAWWIAGPVCHEH